MKRIRRITMEIIQRRQQLTLAPGGAPPPPKPVSAEPEPGLAEPTGQTAVCPHCGSPWVLVHDPESAGAPSRLPDLNAAFACLDLHLQSTPAGRLWLCRRSFDRLKEIQ